MQAALARALAGLTTGIYVLTVRDGERRHGMSSSWVTQVSGDPALLMAAVDRRHQTHAVLRRTGRFALNVVGRQGKALEDYFLRLCRRDHPPMKTRAVTAGTAVPTGVHEDSSRGCVAVRALPTVSSDP